MTTASKSVFYDGQSSVPKNIQLWFDSNTGQFTFEIENKIVHNEELESYPKPVESFSWLMSDIVFENRSNVLFLQHGQDPIQSIKITDVALITTINQYRKDSGQLNWYQTLIQKPLQFHVLLAFFLLATIGLSYIYILPWVGEKSVVLIPESYDDALGGTFIDENSLLGTNDTLKSKLLNQFAAELQLNNKKRLKFNVIDSEIMNAYALPDGTIVVYTGILNEMKSYDELVGLIGHEAAHVNNRHSMKMLCRNLSGYIFISTVLGDVNGVMAVLGDNVNTLQSLSFSREFEREADEDGFAIVTKNKVNPKGMVTLFKRLQEEHSIEVPEFLSTHPVTKDRIETIKTLIDSKKYTYEQNTNLKSIFEKLKN